MILNLNTFKIPDKRRKKNYYYELGVINKVKNNSENRYPYYYRNADDDPPHKLLLIPIITKFEKNKIPKVSHNKMFLKIIHHILFSGIIILKK